MATYFALTCVDGECRICAYTTNDPATDPIPGYDDLLASVPTRDDRSVRVVNTFDEAYYCYYVPERREIVHGYFLEASSHLYGKREVLADFEDGEIEDVAFAMENSTTGNSEEEMGRRLIVAIYTATGVSIRQYIFDVFKCEFVASNSAEADTRILRNIDAPGRTLTAVTHKIFEADEEFPAEASSRVFAINKLYDWNLLGVIAFHTVRYLLFSKDDDFILVRIGQYALPSAHVLRASATGPRLSVSKIHAASADEEYIVIDDPERGAFRLIVDQRAYKKADASLPDQGIEGYVPTEGAGLAFKRVTYDMLTLRKIDKFPSGIVGSFRAINVLQVFFSDEFVEHVRALEAAAPAARAPARGFLQALQNRERERDRALLIPRQLVQPIGVRRLPTDHLYAYVDRVGGVAVLTVVNINVARPPSHTIVARHALPRIKAAARGFAIVAMRAGDTLYAVASHSVDSVATYMLFVVNLLTGASTLHTTQNLTSNDISHLHLDRHCLYLEVRNHSAMSIRFALADKTFMPMTVDEMRVLASRIRTDPEVLTTTFVVGPLLAYYMYTDADNKHTYCYFGADNLPLRIRVHGAEIGARRELLNVVGNRAYFGCGAKLLMCIVENVGDIHSWTVVSAVLEFHHELDDNGRIFLFGDDAGIHVTLTGEQFIFTGFLSYDDIDTANYEMKDGIMTCRIGTHEIAIDTAIAGPMRSSVVPVRTARSAALAHSDEPSGAAGPDEAGAFE